MLDVLFSALKSWKTTLGGIGIIVTAAVGYSQGVTSSTELLLAIIAGITAIFTKDANVTGTTATPKVG